MLKRDAQRIFKYATILDTCIARFTREPTRSALGVPFGSSRAKPDTHVARDARDPAERGSIRIVARAVAARQSRTRTASYPGTGPPPGYRGSVTRLGIDNFREDTSVGPR